MRISSFGLWFWISESWGSGLPFWLGGGALVLPLVLLALRSGNGKTPEAPRRPIAKIRGKSAMCEKQGAGVVNGQSGTNIS